MMRLIRLLVALLTIVVVHAQQDSCQADTDCLNGGTCETAGNGDISHSNEGSFKYCHCLAAYSGLKCQTYCPLECKNGGTCLYQPDAHAQSPLFTDYVCQCRNRFKGVLCDIPYEECPDGLQCLNGSQCKVTDDNDDVSAATYACECPYTHEGIFCESELEVVRCPDDTQCINGGVCKLSDATDDPIDVYECSCPETHRGIYCQVLKASDGRKRIGSGGSAGVAIACLVVAAVALVVVWKRRSSSRRQSSAPSGEFAIDGGANGAVKHEIPSSSNDIPAVGEDGKMREMI